VERNLGERQVSEAGVQVACTLPDNGQTLTLPPPSPSPDATHEPEPEANQATEQAPGATEAAEGEPEAISAAPTPQNADNATAEPVLSQGVEYYRDPTTGEVREGFRDGNGRLRDAVTKQYASETGELNRRRDRIRTFFALGQSGCEEIDKKVVALRKLLQEALTTSGVELNLAKDGQILEACAYYGQFLWMTDLQETAELTRGERIACLNAATTATGAMNRAISRLGFSDIVGTGPRQGNPVTKGQPTVKQATPVKYFAVRYRDPATGKTIEGYGGGNGKVYLGFDPAEI
jgi:hypothetical protein